MNAGPCCLTIITLRPFPFYMLSWWTKASSSWSRHDALVFRYWPERPDFPSSRISKTSECRWDKANEQVRCKTTVRRVRSKGVFRLWRLNWFFSFYIILVYHFKLEVNYFLNFVRNLFIFLLFPSLTSVVMELISRIIEICCIPELQFLKFSLINFNLFQ